MDNKFGMIDEIRSCFSRKTKRYLKMDYISYIRSKVGQEKIFLNFSAGILADEDGRILLQLRGDNQT